MRPELLPAEANCAGGGVGFDVADADAPAHEALLLGDVSGFAGDDELGLPTGFGEDFHVGPGDPAAPAGADHFQHRFLGGEPSGEMFEISFRIARTILLLGRCETAVEKSLAVLVHELADARRLDDVDPVAEDWHDLL